MYVCMYAMVCVAYCEPSKCEECLQHRHVLNRVRVGKLPFKISLGCRPFALDFAALSQSMIGILRPKFTVFLDAIN